MKFLDYIQGSRRGRYAQKIEYSALSDPFMADAIDGYDLFTTNQTNMVLQLQADVRLRTAVPNNKYNLFWKITVAAVVFVAVLVGYSLLMNHKSSMMLAHTQDNSYINIYVPDSYVNQKGIELAEQKELNPSQEVKIATTVDIANIDEVIKPVEKIDIYVPATYAQHLSKEDVSPIATMQSSKAILSANGRNLANLSESEIEKNNEKYSLEQNLALASSMSDQRTSPSAEANDLGNISASNANGLFSDAGLLAMSKKKKEFIPEPVIGYKLYNIYLKENKAQIYDPSCKTTTGMVILSFKVNNGGRPTNIVVDQGLCNPCNNEAIRLLNEGCDWTQSTSRGQLKVSFNEE